MQSWKFLRLRLGQTNLMEPLYTVLFRVNLFFLNVLGLGSQSAVGERCYNFLPPTESHGRALATHFRQGAGKITTKCKFLWLDKLSFKLTSITCVVQGKTQAVIQKLCVFFFFYPSSLRCNAFLRWSSRNVPWTSKLQQLSIDRKGSRLQLSFPFLGEVFL